MTASGAPRAVLLLGATGRTGRRVLQQLLQRGIPVRAIVRSAERPPAGGADDPRLTVAEADVTTLPGEELRPAAPVRLVLMSSVSVNRPARADARRGAGERAFASLLRALLPPARDNQRAADVLALEVGADAPSVEWAVVLPDSLVDGWAWRGRRMAPT